MTRQLTGVILVAAYLTVRGVWPKRGLSLFRRSAFAGLAQLVMAIGFFGSVAYIDVSLAVLIIYFHIFLFALIGWSRGGERITTLQQICIFTAIVGLGFVLSVSFESINLLVIGLSVVGMLASHSVVSIRRQYFQRERAIRSQLLYD